MSKDLVSSIFLSDLTVVDHGYIDNKGRVIGGSFNPGFIITGSIDPIENVVVDFSTIKKDVKGLIDRHIDNIYENGFDHKIWFIEGYSLGTIGSSDHANRYVIKTPAVELEIPADAIKYIKQIGHDINYSIEYIGIQLAAYVKKYLSEKYPLINVNVECFNNINIHTINKEYPYEYFTYSHGLKDSTSYGCQNNSHGHLSFIQHSDVRVVYTIAAELNNVIFINKDNIVFEDNETLDIRYTTTRGLFFASYNKALNKIIVLPNETTIEHLAEYIKHRFGITDFYVSEGLSKGTFIS